MKRTKLLSLTLAFALVLTTVFVGAESVFADTSDIQLEGPTIGASVEDAGLMKAADDSTALNPVAAVNLNTTTAKWQRTNPFSYSKPIYVPISIPKAGHFVFNVWAENTAAVYICSDMNDITNTMVAQYTVPAAQTDDDYYTISKQIKTAGTYYLIFAGEDNTETFCDVTIGYVPATKALSTTTMKSGKTKYASVDNGKYRYFKITVPGTRYLKIYFPDGDGGDYSNYKVKLLNSSKKKNLFKGVVNVNKGKNFITYAGVPKGTYYVAVATTTDTCYQLKVTATKVNEKSGSSKAKANKISKGGVRYGIITATQSNSSGDWYKFVVGSNQVVQFEVDTLTGGYSGGLRLTFYDSRKAFGTSECYYGEPNKIVTPATDYNGGRLSPGTYWIKVQKYGSSSGYYKLKWK